MSKNSLSCFQRLIFFDLFFVFQIYAIEFGKMYAIEITCDKEKKRSYEESKWTGQMCPAHTQRVNTAAFHPDATRRKPGLITVKAHGNALRKYSSASFFSQAQSSNCIWHFLRASAEYTGWSGNNLARITGIVANTRHFEVLVNTLRREKVGRIKPQTWTLNITFSRV